MSLYPVNLNIKDRLCLVVGGGPVAFRKTGGLLRAGAKVRVISPDLVRDLAELAAAGEVEWFKRTFAEGDLDSVELVFAATSNREVQALIAEEAGKKNVLLNSADDPAQSSFHVPAHFRRGPILVTVSTGGSSPALAKKLREQLEAEIGLEYKAVAGLMGCIRQGVIDASGDSQVSGEIFKSLLQKGLVERVRTQNWFDLQLLLIEVLPKELDSAAIMKKFLDSFGED